MKKLSRLLVLLFVVAFPPLTNASCESNTNGVHIDKILYHVVDDPTIGPGFTIEEDSNAANPTVMMLLPSISTLFSDDSFANALFSLLLFAKREHFPVSFFCNSTGYVTDLSVGIPESSP